MSKMHITSRCYQYGCEFDIFLIYTNAQKPLDFLSFISFQQGYNKDIFRIVTFGIHYILVWLQLALSFVPNPVYISQKVKQNSTAYYVLYGDKNALGFQTLWEITSCLISIIVLLKN